MPRYIFRRSAPAGSISSGDTTLTYTESAGCRTTHNERISSSVHASTQTGHLGTELDMGTLY